MTNCNWAYPLLISAKHMRILNEIENARILSTLKRDGPILIVVNFPLNSFWTANQFLMQCHSDTVHLTDRQNWNFFSVKYNSLLVGMNKLSLDDSPKRKLSYKLHFVASCINKLLLHQSWSSRSNSNYQNGNFHILDLYNLQFFTQWNTKPIAICVHFHGRLSENICSFKFPFR